VDTLQSAGKTWVASGDRVYRGWALKLLVACLLLPAWVGASSMLVRHRREWNVGAAIGSCLRAMLAALVSLMALWSLSGLGLMPDFSDTPPTPDAVANVHVGAMLVWIAITAGAWLLARGPDWRRAPHSVSDSHADVAVAVAMGCVIGGLLLASNPYAVVLLAPALHAWLLLNSRRVHGARPVALVWSLTLIGPAIAVLVISTAFDLGAQSPWYLLELIRARALAASTLLPLAAAAGLACFVLVAGLGRTAQPALPTLRRRYAERGAVALLPSMRLPELPKRRPARPSRPPRVLSRDTSGGPSGGDRTDRPARNRLKSR
jgi:hypothetical protein